MPMSLRRPTRRAVLGVIGIGRLCVRSVLAGGMPVIQLDHVALAVRDLDAADRLLRERFGLGSVAGGAHPLWGTANRIVPLGRHFIEVVGVVDAARAAANPVGRMIADQTRGGDRFIGVCLNTSDQAGTAAKLGIGWVEGSRDTAAGRLTFRSAGLERSLAEGASWPYFSSMTIPCSGSASATRATECGPKVSRASR